MKTLSKLFVVSILLIICGTLRAESSDDSTRIVIGEPIVIDGVKYYPHNNKNIKTAIKTLQESQITLTTILEDPENGIPTMLIGQSEGIVIFPNALKIALGTVGGQGALGVAMVRKVDSTWSNPFFVTLGEGSLGFQIGAQKSEIVLLFEKREDLLAIDKVELTLGGDVGVAAGPSNHSTSATTDIKFESRIYSYSMSKGLFAGISLKGGILSFNNRVNESLYCMEDVNPDYILNEFQTPYNEDVQQLIETLDMNGAL